MTYNCSVIKIYAYTLKTCSKDYFTLLAWHLSNQDLCKKKKSSKINNVQVCEIKWQPTVCLDHDLTLDLLTSFTHFLPNSHLIFDNIFLKVITASDVMFLSMAGNRTK